MALYPGLAGNKFWENLWRPHAAVSLDPRACRRSNPYQRHQDLLRMAAEEDGVRVVDLPFSQYTVDKAKAKAGYGCSACAHIQAYLIITFLLDGVSTLNLKVEEWRKLLLKLVAEFDTSSASRGGSLPTPSLKDRARAEGAEITTKEMPTVDTDDLLRTIESAGELADAMESYARDHGFPFAVMLTVPKSTKNGAPGPTRKEDTGNSFAIFCSRCGSQVVDTHARSDSDGEDLGMCVATAEPGYAHISQWICSALIPKIGCLCTLDLVFVQIPGSYWVHHVDQSLSGSIALRRMAAMSDILADSRMLPGDFLLRQFNDDPLLQLCCTGMKI